LENIGSIFRTADATGVSKIFLCGISGTPPRSGFSAWRKNLATLHPKIAKAALGADQTIPFEYHAQTWRLIQKLKKEGVQIVALEQGRHAVDYRKFKPTFPLALIVGNEVKGISKKVLASADDIIFLPMTGRKESLNVAVAFGISAYNIKF